MKKTIRSAVFTASFIALMTGFAAAGHAAPKPCYWAWWPSHWQNLTFKPYLDNPTQDQNSQWDNRKWTPADWAAQRPGGEKQLIAGFFTAQIFSRQYVDNHLPVLEVGPAFYDLSGYDKRRVLRILDDAYHITSNHPNAMFTLTDWRTHKPIGLYTAYGLQLQ